MACGFWDCATYLLGGALVGTVAGIGGTYLLSGKRGQERIAAVRRRLRLKEPEAAPATAGLAGSWGQGRRYRPRKLPLGGAACGCGGQQDADSLCV